MNIIFKLVCGISLSICVAASVFGQKWNILAQLVPYSPIAWTVDEGLYYASPYDIIAFNELAAAWDTIKARGDSTYGKYIFFANQKLGLRTEGVYAFVTTDSGQVWKKTDPNGYDELLATCITPSGRMLLGGRYLNIVTSTDSGATWNTALFRDDPNIGLIRFPIRYFSFIDEQNGWAAAGDGITIFLRTRDGGLSWEVPADIQHDGIGGEARGFTMIDSSNGWTVQSQGLRRTTDGCKTWTKVNGLDQLTTSNSFFMHPGGFGGVGGYRSEAGNNVAVAYFTTNYGETWLEASPPGYTSVSTILSADDKRLIVLAYGGEGGGVSFLRTDALAEVRNLPEREAPRLSLHADGRWYLAIEHGDISIEQFDLLGRVIRIHHIYSNNTEIPLEQFRATTTTLLRFFQADGVSKTSVVLSRQQ